MATREFSRTPVLGFVMFVAEVVFLGLAIGLLITGAHSDSALRIIAGVGFFLLFGFTLPGFFVVQPNEAAVLLLFGRYTGSVKQNGFWWVNPFTTRRRLSLRARN